MDYVVDYDGGLSFSSITVLIANVTHSTHICDYTNHHLQPRLRVLFDKV